MELTRRDALVAAAGGGVGLSGGALLAAARSGLGDRRSVSGSKWATKSTLEAVSETAIETQEKVRITFVAVARAIYPSGVSEVEAFVRTYVEERFGAVGASGTDGVGPGDDRDAVVATVRDLDSFAKGWHGVSINELDPGVVETLLCDIGVDTASADPSGTMSQRVRYHVVNELHYALFASPTGGSLVGIENPVGHPGGTESYQRGPSA